MLLDRINGPNDIKNIRPEHYDALASEIRRFLLEKISRTGGHLASNLGAVELTMALHLVLDFPKDKLIWDVGHQSYTHKILTGRKEGFDSLRGLGMMSGFPNHAESECDAFNTGHSSTSISAGLGMVRARELSGGDYAVVSVIGDGSLTGGMAYEALNNASGLKSNFIIVLNDNNMSISRNVGGISRMLNNLRTAPSYANMKSDIKHGLSRIPDNGSRIVRRVQKLKNSLKQLVINGMFFEEMGLTYLGPFDGHNVKSLARAIKEARRVNKAVVVHVISKKGKGYVPAERNPADFHGVGAFSIKTGLPLKPSKKPTYTDIFSKALLHIAKNDAKVTAITAAMPDGTGLAPFHKKFPERFFDVGIAEEHAVTFAAGLAAAGMKPYVCIYSSFLQRGFDQIIHDICLQGLNVKLCIDRAGIVGFDGETHQGIFDLSYLLLIPDLVICTPKNGAELTGMILFSAKYKGPMAIRYPRGTAYDGLSEFNEPIQLGCAEVLYRESDIAIIAAGSMVGTGAQVRRILKEKGRGVTLVNARFIKPFDEELIMELSQDHGVIVTMEENVRSGGFGMAINAFCSEEELDVRVINIAIPDQYVEHGDVDCLKHILGIDADGAAAAIIRELGI